MEHREIDYIDHIIDYKRFYENYLLKNKPCHLSGIYTKDWKCRKEWVYNNQVNLSQLKSYFQNATVPVVDCNNRYFSSHKKDDMLMSNFLAYWEDRNDSILYLKDWHCQRDFNTLDIYKVPEIFQSDWLNEYWDYKDGGNDDYRFVYIGVKGSWTPLHADVFHSYSWSANICGLKKWLLYPPGEEVNLKDKFGKLAHSITEKLDVLQYPLSINACKPIVVFQKEGEIIFIPSGWHHQVINLEDTISINHNWVNATSISCMWDYICEQLIKVEIEINDCKEMDGFSTQCQLMLNACVGIDFTGFYDMLKKLIETRMLILRQKNDIEISTLLATAFVGAKSQSNTFVPNVGTKVHIQYICNDLLKLKEIMFLLLQHPRSKEILSADFYKQGHILIKEIEVLSC